MKAFLQIVSIIRTAHNDEWLNVSPESIAVRKMHGLRINQLVESGSL